MLEIRLGSRTITIAGHHADELAATIIAVLVLVPWLIIAIWQ